MYVNQGVEHGSNSNEPAFHHRRLCYLNKRRVELGDLETLITIAGRLEGRQRSQRNCAPTRALDQSIRVARLSANNGDLLFVQYDDAVGRCDVLIDFPRHVHLALSVMQLWRQFVMDGESIIVVPNERRLIAIASDIPYVSSQCDETSRSSQGSGWEWCKLHLQNCNSLHRRTQIAILVQSSGPLMDIGH